MESESKLTPYKMNYNETNHNEQTFAQSKPNITQEFSQMNMTHQGFGVNRVLPL